MPTTLSRTPARRNLAWRMFDPRDCRRVDESLLQGKQPPCPCCGGVLEASPETRLARFLPLDAGGFDLECHACHRYRCVVRHSERSVRLVRMRRLAAAVNGAGAGVKAPLRARLPAKEPAVLALA